MVSEKEEPSAGSEVPEKVEGDMEEKLNAIFKALSELQSAVKDLASSISASMEATRGLKESLLGSVVTKADLESFMKAFSVGLQSAGEVNRKVQEERYPAPPSKPVKSELSEEVKVPPEEFNVPSQHQLKKSGVSVVKTERTEAVEVRKATMSESSNIITDVLTGKLKGYDLVSKLREVVQG